jgi:hypothetical protein
MKRIIGILVLAVLLIGVLTSCEIEPAPKIKEGRFNFSVTYEEWGEAKTVSGVFVCEYAGRSFTLEGGDLTREWEGHVEGVENLHDTFYATVCVGKTDDGGEILLSLGVFAAHFMGDPDFADSVIEPSLYIAHSSEDNLSSESSDDPEELEGVYGLKIIDYHYDEPIKNSFGK